MKARLYPSGGAPENPLRLAEEFKAALGLTALEGLIRELVRDDAWRPGNLHEKLVKLPWTDILTTNWDTLLERAAHKTLDRSYETVCCISDIPTTRAPRIVKLHGSLPSHRPFIASEEDFRTYPKLFAPFVNLVQQVLLENELCLLGFSGDDPNFLQWSGWVRDQLGTSTRRIYLIGAHELSPARRTLLESRYVSIIDLSPLLKDVDKSTWQQRASELFIDHLVKSKPPKPWQWILQSSRNSSPEQHQEGLTKYIDLWRLERLSYPGWLVAPPNVRRELVRTAFDPSILTKATLDQLSSRDQGRLAFELVWRLEKALSPIPTWLRDSFEQFVDTERCWGDESERDFVAAALLCDARRDRDQVRFARWRSFLDARTQSNSDLTTEVLYQRCLWARDGLEFSELRNLLSSLRGADPVWKMRQAALYCDLGNTADAEKIIEEAIHDLRDRLSRDRESVWLLSRMSWAQFLYTGVRSWKSLRDEDKESEWRQLASRNREAEIDPWEIIHDLERKIEDDLQRVMKQRRTIELRFEPGTYRDHSSDMYFGSSTSAAIYEIGVLAEVAGVPARANHMHILSPRMERAEVLTGYTYEDDSDYLRLLRIVQSGADDFAAKAFGRIQVARLPEERVAMLYSTLSGARDYALEQLTHRDGFGDDFWSGRLARYTEIISRLSVRLPEDECIALFRRGLEYARDFRWKSRELFDSLGHLLRRCFSSLRPSTQKTLIAELMAFPLPDDAGVSDAWDSDWPEPAEWLPEKIMERPNPDTQFASIVSTLIEKVATAGKETRSRAALRLTNLCLAGALSAEEGKRFGDALWLRRDLHDMPADTNLYSHIFLLLPSPDPTAVVRSFNSVAHEPSPAHSLIAISRAKTIDKDGLQRSFLTAERAQAIFKDILEWQPREQRPHDFGASHQENALFKKAAGAALADAVLPALSAATLDQQTVDRIFALVEERVIPTVAQALPELTKMLPCIEARAVRAILRAMMSIDSDSSWAGFNALLRWMKMNQMGILPTIPRRLLDSVVSVIEMRREPALLHALTLAPQLLKMNVLTHDDEERLASALEFILIETCYEDQNLNDRSMTTFTLKRAAAVKVADALQQKGNTDTTVVRWLQSAKQDPLPEVRYALDREDGE